jgi:DNA modification methylase
MNEKIPSLASKQLEPLLTSISEILPHPDNYKKHPPEQIKSLRASVKAFGWTAPIKVNLDGIIVAGHGMYQLALEDGYTHVPVIVEALDERLSKAYLVADNETQRKGITEQDQLQSLLQEINEISDFDIEAVGFSSDDIDSLLDGINPDSVGGIAGGNVTPSEARSTLNKTFLVPPFTILDARQGYWQERKRSWIGIGLRSSEGRYGTQESLGNAYITKMKVDGITPDLINIPDWATESIFDPVLCELSYLWFTNTNFKILDPFAGGSVRGIIANYLHRDYTGIDIRQEQIDANIKQGFKILPDNTPNWICGDSVNICDIANGEYDFILSCPPYADLEVYSDLPNDISNMEYSKFIEIYRDIVSKACSMLKNNRFACFVVGEVRDNKGNYYNFVSDTIKAFTDVGLSYYNEAILITQASTASIRASRQFSAGRKLVKTHQNVLVFVKGDPKKATEACGIVEVPELENIQEN